MSFLEGPQNACFIYKRIDDDDDDDNDEQGRLCTAISVKCLENTW